MANAVYIETARKMIDSGDPVDLTVLTKDGRILRMENCVGLKYDFRQGTRRVKLLKSREIREIRDVLIMEINNMTVYI